MGLRFRKSIKILPGVSINISKTGVSATIGPKGKSINVGTNGISAISAWARTVLPQEAG